MNELMNTLQIYPAQHHENYFNRYQYEREKLQPLPLKMPTRRRLIDVRNIYDNSTFRKNYEVSQNTFDDILKDLDERAPPPLTPLQTSRGGQKSLLDNINLQKEKQAEHEAVIKEIFEDAHKSPVFETNNRLRAENNSDMFPPCFNAILSSGNQTDTFNAQLDSSPRLKLDSPDDLDHILSSQEGMDDVELSDTLKNTDESSIISTRDLEFITETNKKLESMLTRKIKTENIFENTDEFNDDLFDSLDRSSNNNFNFNRENSCDVFSENSYNLNIEEFGNDISFLSEQDNSESFYEIIEEHVRNKKSKNSGINLKPEIRERYTEQEQEIIKRFIKSDLTTNQLPLPRIDFELQEIIKRERKKLKNRVAASKCRRKKLEREARLELKVSHLKDQSLELTSIALALRKEATDLKQRIIHHLNAGCNLDFGSPQMHQTPPQLSYYM